jgi:hypothetical protein
MSIDSGGPGESDEREGEEVTFNDELVEKPLRMVADEERRVGREKT